MHTIDEILALWNEDKKVDQTHIDNEVGKLSILHHKYVSMYMEATKDQISTKKRLGKLRNLKVQYFKGMLDRETLKNLGWEQYQGLKPQNSTEWDLMLKNDSDILELQDRIDTNEALLKLLESILWHLKDRGNHLKLMFDYQRFIGGGY